MARSSSVSHWTTDLASPAKLKHTSSPFSFPPSASAPLSDTGTTGIDIIGQESPDDAGRPIRSNPLKYFEKAIENFQAACAKAGEDIPFLPHAGETHGDPDGNLAVAMRRNAKRIAHGFCLPKNKTVQDWVKSKNVCVECCPISNEILGLGPSIKDAAVYKLMKEGVHCALGSDNPTLFR